MSTVADYLGRKSDVSAYSGYSRTNQSKLVQELFGLGYSGSICAGVVKLSQNILTCLFSDTGQIYYDANNERGCSFLSEIRKGHAYSEADIYSLFYLGVTRTQNYLQSLETDDDPDDERWGKVELTNVTVGNGLIQLSISVTSRAGTTHDILTPIPVSP